MNEISKEILNKYQVRKTAKQKQIFRQFIIAELKKYGYLPKEEKIKNNINIIIGDVKTAKIILTAHYDTCAWLPFPNFITPNSLTGLIISQLLMLGVIFLLPYLIEQFLLNILKIDKMTSHFIYDLLLVFICWWIYFGKANKHTANDNTSGVITVLQTALKIPDELKKDVCFILFDNEEKGLCGSKAFVKRYPKIKKEAYIFNFDCVSDGDHLCFFPTKAMEEDEKMISLVKSVFVSKSSKYFKINEGFGIYPSDNMRFNKAFGICALKKWRKLYYLDRIHTSRDTVFDWQNIDFLVEGMIELISLINVRGL